MTDIPGVDFGPNIIGALQGGETNLPVQWHW